MTNTVTADAKATIDQIRGIEEALDPCGLRGYRF